QLRHLSGARQAGQVRWVAALHASRKDRVDVSCSFILNAYTGPVLERLDHGEEAVLLIAAPAGDDAHGAADLPARRARRGGRLWGLRSRLRTCGHEQTQSDHERAAADGWRHATPENDLSSTLAQARK